MNNERVIITKFENIKDHIKRKAVFVVLFDLLAPAKQVADYAT